MNATGTNATGTRIDPLAAFMAGAWTAHGKRPVPLVSTSFAVTVEAGLAVVETTRRFHNDEDASIEATVTFPLPVHATLFSLKARIGERTLAAHTESRAGARQTYETAVDGGRSAVLHEEVLRGIHMLSVGHVPPRTDIEIVTLWATTLSVAATGGTLTIPLTVGDIYGQSTLPDSDALIHGGPLQRADLVVRSADSAVELIGGRLDDSGRAFVPLDAPIDLRIAAWAPRELRGVAADGREVSLRVDRPLAVDRPIDVAILVDHSGSMNDLCSAAPDGRGTGSTTKHDAVVDGLVAIAGRLGELDAVDLWEFDTALGHVGSTRDLPRAARGLDAVYRTPQARLIALAGLLTPPSGGTEIGQALAGTVQQSAAGDILLITDGKSHALQVQALAAAGRRITVVLVGEDSLEAHVGHLAALTGGDIFVAGGADLGDAMVAALSTLRRPHEVPAPILGELRWIRSSRGGFAIAAEWHPSTTTLANDAVGRAVAAVAASLALPSLHVRAAAELAVVEGLVTHLTSLVLVDDEGVVQKGIPGVRKVSLPTPRTGQASVRQKFSHGRTHAVEVVRPGRPAPPAAPASTEFASPPKLSPSGRRTLAEVEREARARALKGQFRKGDHVTRHERLATTSSACIDLSDVGAKIDWDLAPNSLLFGDLSRLDQKTARLIENAAALAELVDLAKSLGLSPIALVVGLLARRASGGNRSAARIANAILGGAGAHRVERLRAMLGLS